MLEQQQQRQYMYEYCRRVRIVRTEFPPRPSFTLASYGVLCPLVHSSPIDVRRSAIEVWLGRGTLDLWLDGGAVESSQPKSTHEGSKGRSCSRW